jgi:hypothetical protein
MKPPYVETNHPSGADLAGWTQNKPRPLWDQSLQPVQVVLQSAFFFTFDLFYCYCAINGSDKNFLSLHSETAARA